MQQVINSLRSMEIKGMDCVQVDMSQPCYRAVLCRFKNRYQCLKWQIAHQALKYYEAKRNENH